jgi:hypothetical protein
MAVKNLHQSFYYHSKYLNSMKRREISMGPSIRNFAQFSVQTSFSVVKSPLQTLLDQPTNIKLAYFKL